MLRIKEGVSVLNLQVPMLIAICVAKDVYSEYGVECVITSANDGIHRSIVHYVGVGIDLRTRNVLVDTQKQEIRDKIKERLGSQYDVVLESDHIHIEFDPR